MIKKILLAVFIVLNVSLVYAAQDFVSVQLGFNGNATELKDVRVESVEMSCQGKSTNQYPSGYIYSGYKYYGPKDLSITFAGPFDGDTREKECSIVSPDTVNEVYFIISKLVISFSYNNLKYSCLIKQQIGPSYDYFHQKNDKLQAQFPNESFVCDEIGTTQIMYRVSPGTSKKMIYSKGSIFIDLP